MDKKIKIDVKEFTALKQHFKHSGCFYPNCDEKTIKAHSIQMNGPLKLISDKVDRQEHQVYYLKDELRFIPNEGVVGSHQNQYRSLNFRGISEASTFRGFCQKHDKIFKDAIEDVPYSGMKEQQFLFMYRAFAHMIHHKISTNKGVSTICDINNEKITKARIELEGINDRGDNSIKKKKESLNNVFDSLNATMNNITEQTPIELSELDANIKFELDEIVRNKDYDCVNFLSRSFEGLFPWACSTVVGYLHPNRIPSSNGIAYSNYYAITVLPDKHSSRTHVMIASLNETPNAKPQMERFRTMQSSEFRKQISNMIIQRATNVFLSPRMINLMDESEFQSIISARLERTKFLDELEVQDYEFNLFSSKYLEY